MTMFIDPNNITIINPWLILTVMTLYFMIILAEMLIVRMYWAHVIKQTKKKIYGSSNR